MTGDLPLILTLQPDPSAQVFFDTLRKKYFPSERNFLTAHLTLFHNLPNIREVWDELEKEAAERGHFTLQVQEPVSIGKGVAFKINSPEAISVHARLRSALKKYVTAQDAHRLWPHVTIQNKVTATEARSTLDEVKKDFRPFSFTTSAFDVWEYEGGPWRHIATLNFTS